MLISSGSRLRSCRAVLIDSSVAGAGRVFRIAHFHLDELLTSSLLRYRTRFCSMANPNLLEILEMQIEPLVRRQSVCYATVAAQQALQTWREQQSCCS